MANYQASRLAKELQSEGWVKREEGRGGKRHSRLEEKLMTKRSRACCESEVVRAEWRLGPDGAGGFMARSIAVATSGRRVGA